MKKFKKVIEYHELDFDLRPNSLFMIVCQPIFYFIITLLSICLMPIMIEDYYSKRKIYWTEIKSTNRKH